MSASFVCNEKCSMVKIEGKFIYVGDDVTSNQLMDAFASLTLSTGDYTKEPVQVIAQCT